MDFNNNMPPFSPDSGSNDNAEFYPKAAAELPPLPDKDDPHSLKQWHCQGVTLSNDQAGPTLIPTSTIHSMEPHG